MITGTVIGYNSTGSSTSRLRARTSIAANSVPTAANPSVPPASSASTARRGRRAAPGTSAPPAAPPAARPRPAGQDPEQLADIERRPIDRRQQQRPQRLACRSRSNARPSASVPENAIAIQRIPAAAPRHRPPLVHEPEGEHQHAGEREEDRREEDLAVRASTSRSLRGDDPHRAHEPGHSGQARPSGDWRHGGVGQGSATAAVSCVVSSTIAPAARAASRRATQRAARRFVQPRERLVEQHQPRLVDQRALERQPLPHPAREARDVSSRRSASPARSSAAPTLRSTSASRTPTRRSGDSPPRSAPDRGRDRVPAGRCGRAAPSLPAAGPRRHNAPRRSTAGAAWTRSTGGWICRRRWGREAW